MIRADMKLGDNADGFVLAIMLIAIAMITVFINQKAVGTKKSFETIGGRGLVIKKVKLKKWTTLFTIIIIATEIIIAVLPAGLLLWNTFMKTSGDYSPSNLSLVHWIGKSDPLIDDGLPGVFRNPAILKGAWNSIKLAFSAALFSALLGVVLGYAIVKGRGTTIIQVYRAACLYPLRDTGNCFWGCLYFDVCKTSGTNSSSIWDFRFVGSCFSR